MNYNLLLVAALMLLVPRVNAQDTLANSGFESWTNQGTYEDLADWNTLNPLSSALGVITATKTTGADVHTGSYGLKLQSKSVLGTIRPGVLTTGVINVANSTIGGGVPVNSRPVYLSGWYKYAPVGIDTALISVVFTKWDAVGDSQIIIGVGGFTETGTVSTYTPFSVEIDYRSADVPDTALIIITSGSNLAPQLNSALIVDDVDFSYTAVGILNRVAIEPISFHPNPAQGFVTFTNYNAQQLNILSLEGKLVFTTELTAGQSRVDLKGFTKGLYILNAVDAKGNVRYGKLLVE
jgi:hypothetical protein